MEPPPSGQVIWAGRALDDLHAIHAHLAADAPATAARFVGRLLDLGDGLALTARGHHLPESRKDARLLPFRQVVHGRYRIIFTRSPRSGVTILLVRHQSRRLPRLHHPRPC